VADILIVEDNPDNMKLFKAVLGLRGHTVTGLTGGDGMMDAVGSRRFDLVLLDIQLPGKDGYQLLDELKHSGRDLPPVVALTAHAMSGDRERAMEAGFDGYLTKPIDVGNFGQEVEKFLTGR
jgi:CheY-like chemotaxis protein